MFASLLTCLQGKPALWNSILEPEDNADDVEHFQDIPDSPSESAEAQEAQKAADVEAEAAGTDEDEDEEDGEDDMGPSTSGREGLPGRRGQVQGFASAGVLPNAPVGYDMRKRYAVLSAAMRCARLRNTWLIRTADAKNIYV